MIEPRTETDRRAELARTVVRHTGGQLPEPRRRPDCFCLEPMLHEYRDDGAPDAAGVARLDQLARKVEVARRLWAFYEPDLSRPVERTLVHDAYAAHLCAVFLSTAARTADPKFLNTAVKMLDGMLLEPALAGDAVLAETAEELVRMLPWACSS
ncbi:MAG: hypothetical protein ACYTGP_04825 [Planctomycetota bacterium]